ncbi:MULTISPECIES: tail fiber domain-containing protein [Mesonia]|uniref:Uncharacterized protein n=1 Tax=Mesonia oceanica TaxID=2687242 RepID=A0AC61Y848_9FLAO|nr:MULTISPECIES: tail fiber domain-containing protein [Mesonia]MAN29447.1 hypothetical protein [Mesonia sp.]MAQ42102.1 hypothetical protein [Mesonia sp.]MBJ97075.1 hypothetical protein [Flavobacteriaceae bacterium]VVV00573.1 hypothetical protein FVB9532_01845 [Mesonia oceanica]|tara:strand:- start:7556 stop:9052 length:1497 start_codon:yes stop_codon:yes gene_type:complete
MKKITLLFSVLLMGLYGIAQNNQSNGPVSTSISSPPSTTGEAFRFRPGIVTQLDQGGFGFTANDRWWSLGRLNTGSQTVFGLRLQNGDKAFTLGYNDVSNNNPRIQWIRNGSSNLEFRVANSFTSTDSNVMVTMKSDGSTVFNNTPISSSSLFPTILSPEKVLVENGSSSSAGGRTSGLRVNTYGQLSNSNFRRRIYYGGNFQAQAGGLSQVGSTANFTGVLGRATGGGATAIGVSGFAENSTTSYSIYGQSSGTSASNDYAGFFEGDVEVTGNLFYGSDRKLKENIESEEDYEVLESMRKLNPVRYTFKENKNVTLPSGLQHGLLAQELEEVFPELVRDIKKPVFDKEGNITGEYEFKSVRYQDLIPLLVQSVKELSEEVEFLKGELNQKGQTLVFNETSSLSTEDKALLMKESYYLAQNYPNPFEGRSVIEYRLPEGAKSASIMIFDMTGNFLKEYQLREQEGKIEITADEFGAGMYLYSLVSGNQEIISKKMIVK